MFDRHKRNNQRIKLLYVQRVAAEYRLEFIKGLSEVFELKILRGLATDKGDVIDAKLPSYLDILSDVVYLFKNQIWYHPLIRATISDFRPDIVVISPTLRDLTFWPLLYLKKRLGFKLVGYGMGQMPGRGKLSNFVHALMQKIVVKRLDALVVYSSAAFDYYRYNLNFKGPIEIAFNAADINGFKSKRACKKTNSQFSLVYVGRIIPEKCLEALIIVVNSRKNLDLKIIGSGDEAYIDELKELAAPSFSRVKFLGPLFGLELNKSLLECDLFVLPSRGGLALNHAMASGLPVLVSVADGCEKDLVLEGHTGFYFDDQDFNMMARRIDNLCEDFSELQRVGQNAAAHIRANFSTESMVRKFKNAFEAIL